MRNSKTVVSILIPLLNEQDNLRDLYQKISEVFLKIPDKDYELVFIDDGSSDISWQIIKELASRDDRVRGVAFSRNFGHQAALAAGLDHVNGQAVITMDADLQHPPELIPALLAKWDEGYEIVYTTRESRQAGRRKNFASQSFYRLFGFLTGIQIPEGAADFRLMSRNVVEHLRRFPERTFFLRGLVFWIGFPSAGIPYQCAVRAKGSTKYSWRKMLLLAIDGISSFSATPLYVSIVIGFVVAFIGFVYGCYAVYVRFFTNLYVPGWSSILVSVLFLGGLNLVAVGVAGNYIAKIYEEVKQRPRYLIKERINIG